MSTYKKQLNLTPEDVMEKDYWKAIRTMRDDVKDKLEKSGPETFTKEFVERIRMSRDLTAPMTEAGNEYGDYSKYEGDKNTVKEVNDKGLGDVGMETFHANWANMIS